MNVQYKKIGISWQTLHDFILTRNTILISLHLWIDAQVYVAAQILYSTNLHMGVQSPELFFPFICFTRKQKKSDVGSLNKLMCYQSHIHVRTKQFQASFINIQLGQHMALKD